MLQFSITLLNADSVNADSCSTYLDHLAEEVNDKLQEAGLISVAELCKNYDLPGDFLSEVSLRTTVLSCLSFIPFFISLM